MEVENNIPMNLNTEFIRSSSISKGMIFILLFGSIRFFLMCNRNSAVQSRYNRVEAREGRCGQNLGQRLVKSWLESVQGKGECCSRKLHWLSRLF